MGVMLLCIFLVLKLTSQNLLENVLILTLKYEKLVNCFVKSGTPVSFCHLDTCLITFFHALIYFGKSFLSKLVLA